ncbi:MAG: hypothetical protein EXR48_03215 [Dehalococcoidia bacterium]|nr:hypothetical protein [Dehalococcoidia bacterium]
MPLTVTDRAAVLLKQLLERRRGGPNQVLRVIVNATGKLVLALDTQRKGDHLISYQGDPLMVVAPKLQERLTTRRLDSVETQKGRSWLLTKSAPKHRSA